MTVPTAARGGSARNSNCPPDSAANKSLHFDGINYRANIWLNGQKIADASDVLGTFRAFEFPIDSLLEPGKPNALAVEIFAPTETDLAITWVDWNPAPADKDMGLWRDVYVTPTGDVTVQNPFVATTLSENYSSASLTVSADLRNTSKEAVKGTLHAQIGSVEVRQSVEIGPIRG